MLPPGLAAGGPFASGDDPSVDAEVLGVEGCCEEGRSYQRDISNVGVGGGATGLWGCFTFLAHADSTVPCQLQLERILASCHLGLCLSASLHLARCVCMLSIVSGYVCSAPGTLQGRAPLFRSVRQCQNPLYK